MTALRYGSATDVGRVRSNNEDSYVVAEPLFAVADGMGGHAAGEVASQEAVEVLQERFADGPATVDTLVHAVAEANRAVWHRAADDTDLRGMGTTVTAVALVVEDGEEHLAIANVGDSRAYLLRQGELSQLTDDHSVAEQMVREGQLLPEEAAIHPQRHVLTRVLGMAPEIEVDCFPILPYKGDRILLCTDGLINEVNDSQIASLLRRRADPAEAARELVEMAKEGGGHDNITVIVVDVVDDDDRSEIASAALADDSEATAGDSTVAAPIVLPPDDGDDAAEAHPPSKATAAGPELEPDAPRSRRFTLRVGLFLLLLVAVLAAGSYATVYYARASYFVGLRGDRVTIFKGRPGGVLWFKPTVQQRTDLAAADVPPSKADDVRNGVEEPTLARARAYVRNLKAEHDALNPPPPPDATTTTTPSPPDTTPTTAAPANP